MKATIHYWCQPASPGATYAAEDIQITIFVPFVPQAGAALQVTPEGEFYEVDNVAWSVRTPDEITVYLREPDEHQELEPWVDMQAQGWRLA